MNHGLIVSEQAKPCTQNHELATERVPSACHPATDPSTDLRPHFDPQAPGLGMKCSRLQVEGIGRVKKKRARSARREHSA